MTVFRWIVAVLAAIGVALVWWFTASGLNSATDIIGVLASTLKGAVGLVSIALIATLLMGNKES